ncbi:hypothetical protein FDECE_7276 [Fusarium decemcellulare]|nr:hypothetical protein FDECE_7276 [Fusarium decemcellulare]
MKGIGLLKTWGVLLNTMAAIASPVVVESLDETPAGWEENQTPSPDEAIELSIGLEPEDHQLLARTLYEVSDPSHANYGKHLSRDAAKALLNPPRAATESVKRWLSDAGVPHHDVRDDGQWIHVRTTVGQAEGMLNTRFGLFSRDDERVLRTREYSVPVEIRDHITTIQPTTFFPSRKRTRNTQDRAPESKQAIKRGPVYTQGNDGNHGGPGPIDLNKCKERLTPACIRKIYKMPLHDYPKAHRKSLYGIIGFIDQNAQYEELEEFLERYAPDLEGTSFSVALANGGQNLQGNVASLEANMDIQYAIALASQVPVQFISVGGKKYDFISDLDMKPNSSTEHRYAEPFLDLTKYLVNLRDRDLPSVIAISYGSNEQHFPKHYARQVCNMFGQLGTRGVSVVVAGGNSGVGISCKSNDGKNKTKFLPSFPATCPYVTAVGGTEGNSPEVGWAYSAGGFSEYWDRPWWQEQAVKKYLKTHGDEWKGYYNPKGRAVPDVAALAWAHRFMNHGEDQQGGGTSAASPTFGAVIALLNNERFKKGKPALGFLNPWIYQTGKNGLTDITQGKSVGCQGTSREGTPAPVIPNAGWKAAQGWDPITGWGTPRYDKLRRLAT